MKSTKAQLAAHVEAQAAEIKALRRELERAEHVIEGEKEQWQCLAKQYNAINRACFVLVLLKRTLRHSDNRSQGHFLLHKLALHCKQFLTGPGLKDVACRLL
jgi:hypothetical protein